MREKIPPNFNGAVIIDYEGYPLSLYSPCTQRDICEPRIEEEFRLDPNISQEEAERRADEKYKRYKKNISWGHYEKEKNFDLMQNGESIAKFLVIEICLLTNADVG